ncbi:MAG: cellulase family glycosylhydrolase [Patescibacteria group bacterium]|nr:cellulase family glycosylhydrolase [Patescibacteria group bacterium]
MWTSLKIIKKILVVLIIVIFLAVILSLGKNYPKAELSYGVTFAKSYAEFLGLDWKKTYTDILDDLGVRKLRIPAFWDEIQAKGQNDYDYSALDWQINEAGKRNAAIILAVGYRLPRWPECHLPAWAKNLSAEQKQQDTLNYIRKTVERYKDKDQIMAWQVENEPFLSFFGECPPFDPAFLDKEIALVRSLDSRPIVVTDSGELSFWVQAAKRADIFGTSMYLNTYSGNTKSYVHYPILPGFFHFKKNIVSLFAHPKDWIVIEMQGEPWGPVAVTALSEKDMAQTMTIDKFKYLINFGQKTGFKNFYLWGAEWWAYEREIKGDSGYWDYAKTLFK